MPLLVDLSLLVVCAHELCGVHTGSRLRQERLSSTAGLAALLARAAGKKKGSTRQQLWRLKSCSKVSSSQLSLSCPRHYRAPHATMRHKSALNNAVSQHAAALNASY